MTVSRLLPAAQRSSVHFIPASRFSSSVISAFGSEPVTAVVCGASRGIGRAIVERLQQEAGVSHIFALSRSGEAPSATAGFPPTTPVQVDVTNEASIQEASEIVGKQTSKVNLMINCAGLLQNDSMNIQAERSLRQIDPEAAMKAYAVNALGPLLMAKHFSSLLPRGTERSVIANLSARVGSISDNGLGGWYSYRASKAAQNMFTKNLSIELARKHKGVICCALHPGTVATDLSAPFQANVTKEKLFSTERASTQLLEVIDGFDSSDNGSFFAWDGTEIPW